MKRKLISILLVFTLLTSLAPVSVFAEGEPAAVTEEAEVQAVPAPEPTEKPTPEPTQVPTPESTEVPVPEPTAAPTPESTAASTEEPAAEDPAAPAEPIMEPLEVPEQNTSAGLVNEDEPVFTTEESDESDDGASPDAAEVPEAPEANAGSDTDTDGSGDISLKTATGIPEATDNAQSNEPAPEAFEEIGGGGSASNRAAKADSGSCGDDLTWTLDDNGVLTVTGSGEMTDYGYGVDGDGAPWYQSRLEIIEIIIGNGVTSISSQAFCRYPNLAGITIPDTVTYIGDDAFADCTSLTEVIYSGSSSQWDFVFKGNNNDALYNASIRFGRFEILVEHTENGTLDVSVNGEASSIAAEGDTVTLTVIPDPAYELDILSVKQGEADIEITETEDSGYTFLMPDGDVSVSVSFTVKIIASGKCGNDLTWTLDAKDLLTVSGTGAMYDYSGSSDMPWYDYLADIKTVVIETGVASVGSYAFEGCSAITSVSIADSVESVGEGAFHLCSSLTGITIPDGVSVIEHETFSGCSSLAGISFPESVTSIGESAFYRCTSLGWISLPSGLTGIGDEAFRGCSSLSGISFSGSLVSIGIRAFYGCSQLSYALLPGSLTSIGKAAFYNCTALTDVSIPYGIVTIEDSTFRGCSSLSSLYIPDSVTTIKEYAFQNCSALENIRVPSSVSYIGSYAFQNCSGLSSAVLECRITSIDRYTFAACSSLTSVTIPDSVSSIGEFVFADCSSLAQVTIPDSVTIIGGSAFLNCISLGEITIPEDVTALRSAVFTNCTGLGSVTLTGDMPSIEDDSFTNVTAEISYPYGNDTYTEEKMLHYGGTLTWVSAEPVIIADGVCGDDLTWTLEEKGTLSIVGTGPMTDYKSASATPWYAKRSQILSIVIKSGATSIGSYAFYNCSNVSSVSIAGSVSSIGNYAFCNCSSLLTATIPSGVPSIGVSVFQGCSSLTGVTIPSTVTSIGNFAFYNCSSLRSLTIPDSVKTLGNNVFFNCSALRLAVIPDSVESMGDAVFRGCSGLQAAVLSSSLTSIGRNLFLDCGSLSDVILPDRAVTIGESAFQGCSSLSELRIPESVTSIGNYAFRSSGLTEITIPGSVDSVGARAFEYCGSLRTATVSEGVRSLGEFVFYYCTRLADVSLPESLTSVGGSAFYYCESLSSISLPQNVTSISDYTFCECHSLTDVSFSDDLTFIGYCAFDNCYALMNIVIPAGVTYIGYSAFRNCSALMSVTIPDGILSIDGSTFYGCSSLESITLPAGIISIGESAFAGCGYLSDVFFLGAPADRGSIGISDNNVPLVDAVWHYLGADPSGSCGEDLTWALDEHATLTIRGTGKMFDNVSSWDKYRGYITSIVIENGAASIGESAFRDFSKLTDVSIPGSVVSVGKRAFYNCPSLTGITLPENITIIEYDTFSECVNLVSIVVPNNVARIDQYAFNNCRSLTEINLPVSLTYVGYNAFDQCEALSDIYYTGSFAESTIIQIEGNNDCLRDAAWHFFGADPSGACGDDVTWTLDGTGMLTIRGIGKMADFSGTSAVPWARYSSAVSSVVIENGVTSVGDYAFNELRNLSSVSLPDSLTSVGSFSFQFCSALTGIVIPGSVVSIGQRAFHGCFSLTEIILPEGITAIEYDTFSYCSGLVSVVIPKSVGKLGDYAFTGCSSLTEVIIPDGVSSIPYCCFSGCSSLRTVTIPISIRSIGWGAFSDCSSLSDVYYGGAPGMWDTIPIENVNDPLYTAEFHYVYEKGGTCGSNMTWLIDESGVLVISGSGAMDDYSTSLAPWNSFSDEINQISVEEGVVSIGQFAFRNCSSVASAILPESLETVGNGAFTGCSALTDVEYLGSDLGRSTISVGTGNAPLEKAVWHCHGPYPSGNCGDALTWMIDANGTLTISGAGEMPGFYNSTGVPWDRYDQAITSVVIEDGVTSIGKYAFQDCSSLTSAALPENLSSIGERAFYRCSSLTGITIPNGVVSIQYDTFSECVKLAEVSLPDSIVTIDRYAFNNCQTLTEIVLPEGVFSIGYSSFNNCVSLKEISIPESLLSVDDYAFSYCRSLSDVYYGGSVDSWNSISVGVSNSNLLQARIHCARCAHPEEYLVTDPAVPPTCERTGLTEGSHCTLCNTVIRAQEEIPALGHTVMVDPALTPTCEETGLTEGSHCSVCGEILTTQQTVPALGHDWDEGTTTTDPTCTEPGVRTFTCHRDSSHSRTEDIPALGHEWDEGTVTAEPTCTESGVRTFTCHRDGSHSRTEDIPALGHEWDEGATTTAPTCTGPGVKTYTCVNDSTHTRTEEIPALGHTIVIDPEIPATYEETGLTEGSHCSVCGEVFQAREIIPALSDQIHLSETDLVFVAGGSGTIQLLDADGNVLKAAWAAQNDWSVRPDEDVVSVSNGSITARSIGKATITAIYNGMSANATVTVLFKDAANSGDYYYNPVYWAAKSGVTTGTSSTEFAPNNPCTRGQIVAFLWRACGSPEPTNLYNPFKDVRQGAFYYEAVLWAVENGITTGTSATTFSPNSYCTRKQIVTFLWRANGSPEPTSSANPFTDVKATDYFYDAVLWAVEKGITTGTSATTFAPNATCSRGQCVTFLWRAQGKPEP